MFRIQTVIACLATAFAGVGPSSLYSVLNGMTFNPPGYTIVAYQSCMQNQNAGNPCGSFTRFETSNGQYTYQLYGPAPCSGSCCREFHLTLACGPSMAMSGVNENPTCVYSATLTLPQACGIDMTVGNEAASPSSSAPPPTPTSTRTLTATGTPPNTASITASASETQTSTGTGTATTTLTLTATPSTTQTLTATPSTTQTLTATPSTTQTLTATPSTTQTLTATPSTTQTLTATPSFSNTPSSTASAMYLITSFPSTTSTASLSATPTPLYMITAWPSSSPVNVSATSTPLYMITANPSISPNGTNSDLAAMVARLVPPESPTAKILGGVAVGVAGIVLVAYAVNHFRKGGSVSGLVNKIKSQKGAITQAANLLPMNEAQKAKLNAAIDNPESVLPPEAHQAIAVAKNANVYKQQAISALPISDAQKVALSNTVQQLQTQARQRIEHIPLGAQLTSIVKPLVAPPEVLQSFGIGAPVSSVPPVLAQLPTVAEVAQAVQATVSEVAPAPASAPTSVVPITISAEDLADVQALLQAKQLAKQESSQ